MQRKNNNQEQGNPPIKIVTFLKLATTKIVMSRKKKNEITSYQLFFFVIFAFLAVGIAVALIERGRVMAVILVILLALNFALYKIGGKTWQQQKTSTH